MNFNKNDIEFYLLMKEYDSLTKEELAIVGEEVNSKEEFQSLKQLLLVMEESPVEMELIPNPELKGKLVADFEKARWGAEVGALSETKVVSIKEEKEKKKGGYFWLSIAASLTLLIGLFLNREKLFLPENNQLALVETEEIKETEQPKIKIAPFKEFDKENVLEEELVDIVLEKEFETNELKVSEPNVSTVLSNVSVNDVSRFTTSEPESFNWSNSPEGEEELADPSVDFDKNLTMDKDVFDTELEEEISTPSFVASEMDMSDLEELSVNEALLTEVNESVSLKDDKDLIGLLYTAL